VRRAIAFGQVVAEVIAKLRNPADVLAVALVSKRMNQTVRGSFQRLRIEKRHLGAAHSFLESPTTLFTGENMTGNSQFVMLTVLWEEGGGSGETQAWVLTLSTQAIANLQAFFKGEENSNFAGEGKAKSEHLSEVCQHIAGVMELDVSGCEGVAGSQIRSAVQRMPRLKLLDVSGCRKLTSEFASPAFSMMQPTEGPGPGLLRYTVASHRNSLVAERVGGAMTLYMNIKCCHREGKISCLACK